MHSKKTKKKKSGHEKVAPKVAFAFQNIKMDFIMSRLERPRLLSVPDATGYIECHTELGIHSKLLKYVLSYRDVITYNIPKQKTGAIAKKKEKCLHEGIKMQKISPRIKKMTFYLDD